MRAALYPRRLAEVAWRWCVASPSREDGTCVRVAIDGESGRGAEASASGGLSNRMLWWAALLMAGGLGVSAWTIQRHRS